MVLQELFKKYGYINIIDRAKAIQYDLFVNMLYEDGKNIPPELKYLYISKTRDELFFILDGREQEICRLCEKWDRKISAFITFGSSDRKIVKRLKYNVIQIILYDLPVVDRSEEKSLNVTRKLFVPSSFLENGDINILDEDIVEIPFYLIENKHFEKSNAVLNELKRNLPNSENEIFDFLNVKRKLVFKKKENKILKKNFKEDEYNKIKEWLDTYVDSDD